MYIVVGEVALYPYDLVVHSPLRTSTIRLFGAVGVAVILGLGGTSATAQTDPAVTTTVDTLPPPVTTAPAPPATTPPPVVTDPPVTAPVVTQPPTVIPAPPTTVKKKAPKPPTAGPGAPPSGPTAIDVDISSQTLRVYKSGRLVRTAHVSTGSGKRFCAGGKCQTAHTPRGNFRIYGRHSGWHTSYLGKLYNPLYFSGGYAIHGAGSVPNYPASHGCIRVTVSTANYLAGVIPTGTPVRVHD